ncbi:hypothetical protein EVA_17910 [gut metagenome]|uniref:Uncharacterized protein n=1 Tax=gut metagenome TaxID=749906 RepID=J9G349_9ZZZZ
MKQTTRDGVFDSHQSEAGIVIAHFSKDAFKGVATNEFDLVVGKILMSGDIVKGTVDSLNCDLLHESK